MLDVAGGRWGTRRKAGIVAAMTSCLAILVALAGCATTGTDVAKPLSPAEERELIDEIEMLAKQGGVVQDLAFPILVSNVEACGKRVGPVIGASWITGKELGGWPSGRRNVAKRHFRVAGRPVLDNVVDGGPAAEAGLRRWDIITAVNGRHLLSNGEDGNDVVGILESAANGRRIEIAYERAGKMGKAMVIPVTACHVGVVVVDHDKPNAFTDGRNIYITKGLHAAVTDSALQVIISHQLAHVLEGHVSSEQTRRLLGWTVDKGLTVAVNALILVGGLVATFGGEDVNLHDDFIDIDGLFEDLAGNMFTHRDEREADYLSMVMLERAGVPAATAADFWGGLAQQPGNIGGYVARHPINDERLENLKTILGRVGGELESVVNPINDE